MKRCFFVFMLALVAVCLVQCKCRWPTAPTATPAVTLPPFQIKPVLKLDVERSKEVTTGRTVFAIDQTCAKFYIKEGTTLYTVQQDGVTQTLRLPHPIDYLIVNSTTCHLYATCCDRASQVSIIYDNQVLATRQILEEDQRYWAIAPSSGNVYISGQDSGQLWIYDSLLEPIHTLNIANPGAIWADPERDWVYVFDRDLSHQQVISGTGVIGAVPGRQFLKITPQTGYAHFRDCTVINGLEIIVTPDPHCLWYGPHLVNAGNGMIYRLSPNSDQVSIWQDGMAKVGSHNPDPRDVRPTEGARPGVVDEKYGYVYLPNTENGNKIDERLFVYRESEYLGEVLLPNPMRHALADPVRGWVYVATATEVVVLLEQHIVFMLNVPGVRLLAIDNSSGQVYLEQDGALKVIVPPHNVP